MLRIEVGDGESIVPFAGATIDRLTGLVFAACSLDATTQAPDWFAEAIGDLLRSDPSFRAWAERREVAGPGHCLASHLLEQLSSDTSWMSRLADPQPSNDSQSSNDSHAPSGVEENDSGEWRSPARLARPAGRILCAEEIAHGEQRLWQAVQIARRLLLLQSRFAASLETAKREAIYQLAYGLSHELNNPLANIATRARVLVEDESDPHRQQMLVAIADQAMRGCEMIADLMLVARPPMLRFDEFDLGILLHEVVERSRPWAEKRMVSLIYTKGQAVYPVVGDSVSLGEAIWCLVRNSLEAVAAGGSIEVRCDAERSEEFLRIVIEDDGPGLSAEALKHCFDPYYSGREAGRGLGLGLSKAERIVALHRGKLSIGNRPTGGCIASIELAMNSNSTSN